jgi:hypothetical protein
MKQAEEKQCESRVASLELQVKQIMDTFDFQKVHKAIMLMDLRWNNAATNHQEIPTIEEIKNIAYELLTDAIEGHDRVEHMSGGFITKKESGVLSMFFVIEEQHGELAAKSQRFN